MQTDQKKWRIVRNMFFVAAVLLVLMSGMASAPSSAYADGKIVNPDDKDMWISVGMGLRGGLAMVENRSANGRSYTNTFGIDYARIYINGGINKYLKYEFNTECFDCNGSGNPFGQTTGAEQNQIGLLDAIGKVELNQYVNVWVGRLLVPGPRSELNGPFFSEVFEKYKTPFTSSDFAGKFGTGGAGTYGRDNGITFWGQADRLQYSAGVYTGLQSSSTLGPNQDNSLLYAGRLTYNFFNPEKNPGYYTSGAYFGKAGDILALAVTAQHQKNGAGTRANQADLTYIASDLLFEKPLGNSGDKGVITINAEFQQFFANYNNSATTGAFAGTVAAGDCFCMFDGNSYTGNIMYLLPNKVWIGSFQPYARFTSVQPNNSATRQETEVGTNYIISGFNARFATFWQYGDLASLGTNYSSAATGSFANAIKFAFQFQY